jgi:flagellar FliJ protein
MTALKTVLEQAEAERNQAQLALRQAEDQTTRLKAQADQLTQYRAEYQQRWSGQFSRQGAIEIVQCYQSFMQRLDEAMLQQSQQADAARQQTLRLREQLLAAEVRVASVRKLIERRQLEARRNEQKREQRQADEQALQHLLRRNAESIQH